MIFKHYPINHKNLHFWIQIIMIHPSNHLSRSDLYKSSYIFNQYSLDRFLPLDLQLYLFRTQTQLSFLFSLGLLALYYLSKNYSIKYIEYILIGVFCSNSLTILKWCTLWTSYLCFDLVCLQRTTYLNYLLINTICLA